MGGTWGLPRSYVGAISELGDRKQRVVSDQPASRQIFKIISFVQEPNTNKQERHSNNVRICVVPSPYQVQVNTYHPILVFVRIPNPMQ
jgi:hypothetical protein